MNGRILYSLLPLAILICGFSHTTNAQDDKPRPVARLISAGSINTSVKRISPPVTISASPTLDEATAIERRAFEQTNLIRVQNGLPPLKWDADVCRMARDHSERMSLQRFFAHTTPDGKRLRDRARLVGILTFSVVAENIAYNQGYEDPGAFAVERWMLSPKHRANILSSEFRAMAIGSLRRARWIGVFDTDIHNALSLLKLPSFAKINWTLQILGKRPDGYHEVVTVLQTISLHDELTFELRDDDQICLTCDDPDIPLDGSNLIVKAASALQSGHGVDIHLVKKIPTKGGLGGASSNAAVTLLALNYLWRQELRDTDLLNLARGLGADVPFFLSGGCAEGRGTGTDLRAVADVDEHLIVITPNAAVSTATAYAALKRGSLTTQDSASILSSSFARPVSGESGQWSLHNDFEVVIFEIEPEIERAKVALLEAGARGALLAGSGSSVFGIFDDEPTRDRVLSNLNCEVGWRVFPCHTLSRVEYLQAMGPSGFPLLRSLKNWQADTGA